MVNFKSGDVVQLKSGGPVMTVYSEGRDDVLICVWFDGTERKQGGFKPAMLIEANAT